MTPIVSVIIPNYNHAPYLKERIDSVLNQTYQDFELIILDDCSPDNSVEVIEQYRSNPHVTHIIVNEQNTRNTFIQWERGISLAKGQYIWIAESDDVADPQLLETLVVELMANPQAVIAFCHSQMIGSDSQPIDMTWHPHGSSGRIETYDGSWYNKKRMLVKNHIYNASMVVFKKSVFSAIPSDYQEYRYCGDWLFWTYVCMHGQVIEVCRQLNRYRQHTNKVTAHSKMNGGMWRNLGGIMNKFVELFNLNTLQRHCLCGRWTKRFNKEAKAEDRSISTEYPHVYGGTALDIVLYEIGKLFGFLKN